LLVVIAVIGILAALLLPALSAAKLKARQIQCLSSIKQLTTSALMYSGENARASGYSAPAYPNGHWMGVLLDYYGMQKNVLLCLCAPVRNAPGAISMGLADGHCELVKLDKLWDYYWHLDWDPSTVTHGRSGAEARAP